MNLRTKNIVVIIGTIIQFGCGADAKNGTTKNTDASTDIDGDGYTIADDCDDQDPAIHPNAAERCDGIDNDCDGTIDESPIDGTDQWRDEDGDGYGETADPISSCTLLEGFVEVSGDCDDGDPSIRPIATEYCDGVDNNCDASVDEYSAADAQDWFLDMDGDGFGYGPPSSRSCTGAVNEVDRDGDCDDEDASIHPEAEERCDGVDNDCDALIDEPDAIGSTTHYLDADRDGFGDPTTTTQLCEETDEYLASPGDCDDSDGEIYPGAEERCDSTDNSCSGFVDEACATQHDISDAFAQIAPMNTAFSVGDLSGDGVIDIVTTDAMSGSFALYTGPLSTGEPTPTWTASPSDEASSSGVMLRAGDDINDDGYADLLTAHPYLGDTDPTSEIRVFLGPIVETPDLDSADIRLRNDRADFPLLNPRAMRFADLTGNEQTDILMFTTPDRTLLLWSDPSGEAHVETDVEVLFHLDSHPTSSIATPDYTGDGFADLVIGYPGSGQVDFFDGPIRDAGDVATAEHTITTDDIKFGASLCAADLLGDGHTTVAIATRNSSSTPSTIELFSAEDDFTTPVLRFVGHATHQLGTKTHCEDVDGDGHPDLMTSHNSLTADDGGLAGTITLFHGPIGSLGGGTIDASEDADRVWVGPDDGTMMWLGSTMELGDANDDGVGDLITSAGDTVYLFGGADWTSDSWGPGD